MDQKSLFANYDGGGGDDDDTSFRDLGLSSTTVTPTSQVCISARLLLSVLGN
jgi:hypothetical protein